MRETLLKTNPLPHGWGYLIPKERRGAMKNWSDLESGRVNLHNGRCAPSHGCDRKGLIGEVDGHE